MLRMPSEVMGRGWLIHRQVNGPSAKNPYHVPTFTVKYEEVYLKDYRSVPEARENLDAYFEFYNTERPHQSLGYATPSQIYFGNN